MISNIPLLKITNWLDVAQSLITFNVLTKNVVLLDQMRKRLSTLGLLIEVEKNPTLFEHFFVHQGGQITPDYVKELLNFGTPGLEGETNAELEQLVTRFVDGCNEEELLDLLAFVRNSCFKQVLLFQVQLRWNSLKVMLSICQLA